MKKAQKIQIFFGQGLSKIGNKLNFIELLLNSLVITLWDFGEDTETIAREEKHKRTNPISLYITIQNQHDLNHSNVLITEIAFSIAKKPTLPPTFPLSHFPTLPPPSPYRPPLPLSHPPFPLPPPSLPPFLPPLLSLS